MPNLRSLCVFCGSAPGKEPNHRRAAERLGGILAASKVTLVYGGGHTGMMGALAESTMRAGGRVIGIIPEHLTRVEQAFEGATELIVVDSMHTRKRRMFDRADAFCVLPGGMGTLDETFEIITWKQLRLHNKPVIVVNNGGYWDDWLRLVDGIIAGGYAHPETERLYSVVDSVDEVVTAARKELATAIGGEPQLF